MAKDILYPLRRLHGQLHEARIKSIQKKDARKPFLEKRKKNRKTVFLVLTPEHGNLGDHAIAYAETQLLKKHGIDYYEVTGEMLLKWKRQGILDLMNGNPIVINGGGNLGTLWFPVEEIHREIILKNPRSEIIIMPNTIFYEDSEWGREEFEVSRKLYNQHKKLYLYARECNSYEVMRNAYCNVVLAPDMVLSLPQYGTVKNRKGCLLCLRNDCEKTRTMEQEWSLRQKLTQLFEEQVFDTDMVGESISVEQREAAIKTKFDEFCSAELVVTDRLHAMIFCAITGTPCIVVDSKSPKVRGCYEWIEHLDYIRFADDVSDIVKEYNKIPKKAHKYDNSHLKHYYDELARNILSIL